MKKAYPRLLHEGEPPVVLLVSECAARYATPPDAPVEAAASRAISSKYSMSCLCSSVPSVRSAGSSHPRHRMRSEWISRM
jgi:hypothetical protein